MGLLTSAVGLTNILTAKSEPAEEMSVALDAKELGGKLSLDNSMIEREAELKFEVPSGTKSLSLTIGYKHANPKIINLAVTADYKAKIKIVELLKWLAPGEKATLYVSCEGKRALSRAIELSRSAAAIPLAPGKTKRSLQPLYEEIAQDLKAGKPLVITANVVLWDASFGEGRGRPWADGNRAENNLYWGARYGMYNGFKNLFGWKLVKEEKGKLAVFKKTFSPADPWKKLGVEKPFDIYAVFNVYVADDIRLGYRDFAKNLFSKNEQKIELSDGNVIEAGSQSRIVGYIGHMIYGGAPIIMNMRNAADPAAGPKKGAFMTACISAQVFSHAVLSDNVYGLLFTTDFTAPEAYNQNALFESIARGENGSGITNRVTRAYADYQGVYPSKMFLTSESPRIEEFSLPYEGDSDGDGINNRIDPEPAVKNTFKQEKDKLTVTTSAGKTIEIDINETNYSIIR